MRKRDEIQFYCFRCNKGVNNKAKKFIVDDHLYCCECHREHKKKERLKPIVINCSECGREKTFTNWFTYQARLKANSVSASICSSCIKRGERNPFFNRKHSVEARTKIKTTSKTSEKRKEFWERMASDEHKARRSNYMKENSPTKGSSYYQIWVEKYGVEEADRLNALKREKISKTQRGEKNYWYGKTPPYGSGNGWSGWYKGWYFRSLLELSYMINVIERYRVRWETGESKKYKISYLYKGATRNYFPDFILENKYVVELKPQALWGTQLIQAKTGGARLFCQQKNLTYKIRTVPLLSEKEILELYLTKQIIWLDRYEKKYKEKYLKN